MSIIKRIVEITQAKVNKLLNGLENTNEILDLSYEKMLTGLQEIRAHIADVVTEQKRLESKITQCNKNRAERENEALAALKLGKEDLAQQALELKHTESQTMVEYQQGHDHISQQVEKLKTMEKVYQQRIEKFRQTKEVTKASYQAAQAQVHMTESLAGINSSVGDVGYVIARAQDKSDQMNARAAALSELADTNFLDSDNLVKRELGKAQREASVIDELAQLKKQLKASSTSD